MNNIHVLRDIVFPLFNFGLLIILLYKLTKEPIKAFFYKRSHEIRNGIETEETSKDKVQGDYNELTTKLNDINNEIKKIKTNIIEIAEAESKKIHVEGERLASKMSEDAKKTADYHISKTKLAIQEEIYKNAEKKTIEKLQTTLTDRHNQELIKQLVQTK